MYTYMSLGTNKMNIPDLYDMNNLKTSEMNELDTNKTNVLPLMWVLSLNLAYPT